LFVEDDADIASLLVYNLSDEGCFVESARRGDDAELLLAESMASGQCRRSRCSTVDVHIGRLRKALSRGRERDPIRTVRRSGYSLDETLVKS
jgi:DNA-binding response OmpR family regulator